MYAQSKCFLNAFSGKSSSRNSSRSSFRRYVIFCMSTSTAIVLLMLTLGETNAIHVGYGEEMTTYRNNMSSKFLSIRTIDRKVDSLHRKG